MIKRIGSQTLVLVIRSRELFQIITMDRRSGKASIQSVPVDHYRRQMGRHEIHKQPQYKASVENVVRTAAKNTESGSSLLAWFLLIIILVACIAIGILYLPQIVQFFKH
ncbi:hypothetical protein PAPYR_5934 [Paratrimastix pyriformis]|uniref:Uncharacterized protein n=1 Tax=Paratrimastix pyriformis TaxID=342808 RepID=A0ABQ8UGJ8_9EUKA|nr:hypothetical protein PAPYR_5934 [Paratrimastix pyriformis]